MLFDFLSMSFISLRTTHLLVHVFSYFGSLRFSNLNAADVQCIDDTLYLWNIAAWRCCEGKNTEVWVVGGNVCEDGRICVGA